MTERIRVLSLNTHKGFSYFDLSYKLPELREAIRGVSPDLVFLQEVLGEDHAKTAEIENAPQQSQYEFLADSIWSDFAYGKNAVYPEGHHGNAVLSKFPIQASQHLDISTHSLEQRGILHCEIALPTKQQIVHCLCIHLGLFSFHRKQQYKWIVEYTKKNIPDESPLIIAGDLNDWTHRAERLLAEPLGLKEAFLETQGHLAKSFPVFCPILTLDRIYYRGLHIRSSEVLSFSPWRGLSDHAALMAEFDL